jgi:hypothetical protein
MNGLRQEVGPAVELTNGFGALEVQLHLPAGAIGREDLSRTQLVQDGGEDENKLRRKQRVVVA